MEDDKLYLGPESPADHNRSQGAKNTRTEEEIDEIINLGTYLDDTLEGDADDRPDGTSAGDTVWVSEHEGDQQTEADKRQTSEPDIRWESGWSNQEKDTANRAPEGDTSAVQSGPPRSGDTAHSSISTELPDQKKRLSGAQRRKLARETGKPFTPRPGQKRPAEHSPKGANASKRPFVAPSNNLPTKHYPSKRQRPWSCDVVRKKPHVFLKLKENPQTTAIAVNTSDSFGEFSHKQYDAVIKIIMQEIITLPRNKSFGNEPFTPRFQWHKRIEGLMVFSCVDSQTANWLCTINFSSAWDGAKLRMLVERDFSKLILCKTVLSGPEKKETDIMKMWKLQNKDINFSRWDIKKKTQTDKGTRVMVVLDVPSLRTIRSKGMKVYYGLTRSLFHVVNPAGVDDSIELPSARVLPKTPARKDILPSILSQLTTPNITSNISPLNVATNLLKLNNMLQPNATLPSLISQISSFTSTHSYPQTSGRFDDPPQLSSRFEDSRRSGEANLRFEAPRGSSSSQQYRSVRSSPRSARSPPRSHAYQQSDSARRPDDRDDYRFSSSHIDKTLPPRSDFRSQGGSVSENYSRGRSPQRYDDRIRSDRSSDDYRFQPNSSRSRDTDDRNRPRDIRDINIPSNPSLFSNSAPQYNRDLFAGARFQPYSGR